MTGAWRDSLRFTGKEAGLSSKEISIGNSGFIFGKSGHGIIPGFEIDWRPILLPNT